MSFKKLNAIQSIEIHKVAEDFKSSVTKDDILIIRSGSKEIDSIKEIPFRSNNFSLVIVPNGEVKIRTNMYEHRICKNTILTISPNVIREFTAVSKEATIYAILFNKDAILKSNIGQIYKEAFHFIASKNHQIVHTKTYLFKSIYNLFDMINDLQQKKIQHKTLDLLFFSVLNMINDHLIEDKLQFEESYSNRQSEITIHFFELLSLHIRKERSIQFYAHKMSLTPKYLSTVIKNKTGKSASKIVAEMLILEAKVLLGNPSLTINEVAENCGFSDQFTFSKYFKLHTGESPLFYKKNRHINTTLVI